MSARPQPEIERLPDGRTACTFHLGPDHPGFDGHFPGEPLLPGMCHVDLALHAIACATGRPQELREIRRARFRRKVVPGDALRIAFRADPPDATGARLWRTEHTVSGARTAELLLVLAPRVAEAPGATEE